MFWQRERSNANSCREEGRCVGDGVDIVVISVIVLCCCRWWWYCCSTVSPSLSLLVLLSLMLAVVVIVLVVIIFVVGNSDVVVSADFGNPNTDAPIYGATVPITSGNRTRWFPHHSDGFGYRQKMTHGPGQKSNPRDNRHTGRITL